MKKIATFLLLFSFLFISMISKGQGLENVIVEEVDASSAEAGNTAYRVYLKLADDYQLQAIYGDDNNPLTIQTSTDWYNSAFGGSTGNAIVDAIFGAFPEVNFDSYVSLNAASNSTIGVQAGEDTDGTIDGRIAGTPVAINSPGLSAAIDNNFNAGSASALIVNTIAGGSWATTEDNSNQIPSNTIYVGQYTTDGDFSFQLNVQLRNTNTGVVERFVWTNPNDANETLFPALAFPLVLNDGCTDPSACNYDASANNDDGSCEFPGDSCDDGNTNTTNDILQNDCSCEGELLGCTDQMACNYDASAIVDDGSCLIPEANCSECDGPNLVLIDYDNDGECDATDADIDGDGVENNMDSEPMNEFACQDSDNDTCDDCSSGTFDPLNDGVDTDMDGICDGAGVLGCTDAMACNYNPAATIDNGLCDVPDPDCEICENDMSILNPAADTNNNGLCDSTEIMGCTDSNACNYNMDATFDDGTCFSVGDPCDDGNAMTVNDVYQNDCSCSGEAMVMGCTDNLACNYNVMANVDDNSCEFPGDPCDDGNTDTFDDILLPDCTCEGTEILNGCTDPDACNYDETATVDDGSCIIPDPDCEICDNGIAVLDPASDLNNNGICDLLEGGFENMVVEIYYVSTDDDEADTDGGMLPSNSITYRVYMDLSPTAEFQGIYGNSEDTLHITTSTEFFNNEDRGEVFGSDISFIYLEDNTVALDSYLAIAQASSNHVGVLKANDPDGSIIGGINNDGGSNGVSEGLLINDDPAQVGIPLTTSDGLVSGSAPAITTVGLGAADALFNNQNASGTLELNDLIGGAWVVAPSYPPADNDNHVLVAQFTTNGNLDYCLNAQIRVPQLGGDVLVEKIPGLCYQSVPGCTDETAVNYNPEATVNNGTCMPDGFEEQNLITTFDVFPNPSRGDLTISIELSEEIEGLYISMTDVHGKKVLSEIWNNGRNGIMNLNAVDLKSGVYFINLVSQNGFVSTKKFVKQ